MYETASRYPKSSDEDLHAGNGDMSGNIAHSDDVLSIYPGGKNGAGKCLILAQRYGKLYGDRAGFHLMAGEVY